MSGFIVGLTGGIGSGKTAVAERFAELGVAVVDTDAIAHELTGSDGAAMPAVVAAFGSRFQRPEGGLDRAAMRLLVFSDPPARERLEAILHPLIRVRAAERCRSAESIYAILAVPLLVETGAYLNFCDRILVVDCDDEVRLARVRARNGLAEPEVRAMMAAQASREARLAVASEVLLNDGALSDLVPKVAELHRKYLEMSAAKLQATC